MTFKEAVVAVTYRCNAHCRMCDIWRNGEHVELAPAHYTKIPSTLRTVNITGGEPFLRSDIVDVIKAIHSRIPNARLVFSTNGMNTDSIVSAVQEVTEFHKRVGVGVSIDGIEGTHDRIRGVEGIYRNAMATIHGLKRIGVKDLRLGMTLLPENVREAKSVFRMSNALGVEFTTTYAHDSEIYFMKRTNRLVDIQESMGSELSPIISSHLASLSPKKWARAYHLEGIVNPHLRMEFRSHCEAASRFFFMAPNGDVYPCMVLDNRFGNLGEARTWNELFTDEVRTEVRRAVRSCREDCWMVCNTRSLILAHPFKAGIWVVRNKTKAHTTDAPQPQDDSRVV